MVNKPLIRPYFWGDTLGRGWLTSHKESFQEAGVQAPLGFWDPLGLSTSGNLSDYKRRREVELKHGNLVHEIGGRIKPKNQFRLGRFSIHHCTTIE